MIFSIPFLKLATQARIWSRFAILGVLYLGLLGAHQTLSAQTAPVAGLDAGNALVTLSSMVPFRIEIPNTSSGAITDWDYYVTTTLGQPISPINHFTYTQAHPSISFEPSYPTGPYRVRQIVTGPLGSDTMVVTVYANCWLVDPPIAFWTTVDFSNLPRIHVVSHTTDFTAWGRDLFVSGPAMPHSVFHPQIGAAFDTISSPGVLYVCAMFWGGTCTGSTTTVCDTFIVPCWMPEARFSTQTNGDTVSFIDATAVNGIASYFWDFGDGNTSNLPNPVHVYSQSGTYYPCLMVIDSCGPSTHCDSVNIIAVGTALPQQLDWQASFASESGTLYLQGNAGTLRFQSLHVYDLMGRQIPLQTPLPATWSLPQQVSVPIASGIYVVELVDTDAHRFRRSLLAVRK